MSLLSLTALVLRGSFVLAMALAAAFAARGSTAALRRCILVCGFSASIAAFAVAICFPGRPVVHLGTPGGTVHVVAEALMSSSVATAPASLPDPAAPASRRIPPLATWLVLAWAIGASVVGIRLARSNLLAARLLARSEPRFNGARLSREVDAPVVVGLFRPVVLLPAEAVHWESERLHAAMAHELSHVRRRDALAIFVARMACALYWFQPLAWVGARRLRRECELAADEDVIRAGMRPTTYAAHLLAVARRLSAAPGALAMASPPSELGRRIQVLIERDRLPEPLTRGRTALVLAGALLVLAFVACADARSSASPVKAPEHAKGVDVRLQAIAEDEAARVRAELGARRVAIVVLAPNTGSVLAISDDAPGEPIVPASTLKPLTVALAIDGDAITSSQRFDCGNGQRAYGERVLRDAGQYGSLDAGEILAVSSNVGVSRIFDALRGDRLRDGLERFRVGRPADVADGSLRGAIVAMGEGTITTPVALAAAYGVFANDGVYPGDGRRVIKSTTAHTLRGMLEGVVTGERATGKAAQVHGVRVGGKTGTSDDEDCDSCAQRKGLFASFVGLVPIEQPRFIIYVGVGDPKAGGTGGSVAAPVFARVATRALATGG